MDDLVNKTAAGMCHDLAKYALKNIKGVTAEDENELAEELIEVIGDRIIAITSEDDE